MRSDKCQGKRLLSVQETEGAVKEEVKGLREAMEELSSSAQGLARQRDDARASLARAKTILRRMAPVRHCVPAPSRVLEQDYRGASLIAPGANKQKSLPDFFLFLHPARPPAPASRKDKNNRLLFAPPTNDKLPDSSLAAFLSA